MNSNFKAISLILFFVSIFHISFLTNMVLSFENDPSPLEQKSNSLKEKGGFFNFFKKKKDVEEDDMKKKFTQLFENSESETFDLIERLNDYGIKLHLNTREDVIYFVDLRFGEDICILFKNFMDVLQHLIKEFKNLEFIIWGDRKEFSELEKENQLLNYFSILEDDNLLHVFKWLNRLIKTSENVERRENSKISLKVMQDILIKRGLLKIEIDEEEIKKRDEQIKKDQELAYELQYGKINKDDPDFKMALELAKEWGVSNQEELLVRLSSRE